VQNKVQWSDTFRSVFGLRGDIYNFHVTDFNATNSAMVDPSNSGDQIAALPSPKLSLVFGPWDKTEYYLNGGYAFHSSDARSATATTQPGATNSLTFPRVNGLVQTHGAEIGARTLFLPRLQSTLSVWWLHSDSELLFDNDTGMTTPSPQPSDRYGVEWANYYTPNKTWALDLDYADSIARFVSPDTQDGFNGRYVPEAVSQVLAAGATAHERDFFGSLRLRFFGPRNLVSDGSIRSSATALLSLQLGYHLSRHWTLRADLYNLLDRRDHDIDYYYESRISPAASALSQVHFHPVEPIQSRFALTATF
jgi:outer membrane receptor protein involved in Fe transport